MAAYLQDLIQRYHPARNLRSKSKSLLVCPPTVTKFYGARTFAVASAELWNSLPDKIKDAETIHSFRRMLKTLFIFAMIRLIVAGVSYCVSLILICHCLLTCPIFTLLPSVFFILKAHRDFSLNVICAIQAWFIIIIIMRVHLFRYAAMHAIGTHECVPLLQILQCDIMCCQ